MTSKVEKINARKQIILERKKYDINNYLTETGEITRNLLRKYSLGKEE